MIFLIILSVLIHCVNSNTEKAIFSTSTVFHKLPLAEGIIHGLFHLANNSESSLSFPYKQLNFKSNFGNSSTMYIYYILENIQDFVGEVRVCWPATVICESHNN
jgi:hypothetical protein